MLIIDDFGGEYVGRKHAEHLTAVLKKYHDISEDWEGKNIADIDLIWYYERKHSARTCRLLMTSYIEKLLFKVGHKMPVKTQISPHRCRDITYVSKVQQALEEDSYPALDENGVLQVQLIVGALLYYARTVNNKLLVALSAIGAHQSSAIEKTLKVINQLLYYYVTYPDDGTVYRSIDIILTAHSDSGLNNETKSRIIAGAHIFLSDNEPITRWNGPILTITQIMKYVLSSEAET